jgi:hypothetical protein
MANPWVIAGAVVAFGLGWVARGGARRRPISAPEVLMKAAAEHSRDGGRYFVFAIETDARISSHAFWTWRHARDYANDAASESDGPIAYVFDVDARPVYRR